MKRLPPGSANSGLNISIFIQGASQLATAYPSTPVANTAAAAPQRDGVEAAHIDIPCGSSQTAAEDIKARCLYP